MRSLGEVPLAYSTKEFNKEFRSILAPGADRLQGRFRTECSLWQVFVVELLIALQRGLQIVTRTKTSGGEKVADAPVKAFNPTVGLRVAVGSDDAQCRARRIHDRRRGDLKESCVER